MTQVKDTFPYKLMHKGMAVYFGTIKIEQEGNQIEIRKSKHRNAGEIFDNLEILTNHRMSQADAQQIAKKWIVTCVEKYGRRPKYNKDSDG